MIAPYLRRGAIVLVAVAIAVVLTTPSLAADSPDAARDLLVTAGLFGVAVIACWAGWAAHRSGDDAPDEGEDPFVDGRPESGTDQPEGRTGELLRTDISRAIRLYASGVPSTAKRDVREEFRDAAVAAEQHATGSTPETAREAVDAGEWTHDPVAAAFLAAPDAEVDYPFGHLVYEWFLPGAALRSRIERAADAVAERYEDGEAAIDRPRGADPITAEDVLADGPASNAGRRNDADDPQAEADAAAAYEEVDVDPESLERVVGATLARTVARAAAYRLSSLSRPSRVELRDELRSAAVELVAQETDTPHDAARELVEAGEWTDDPVAAAFLADADVEHDTSLLESTYEWIAPGDAFDRRVVRTAATIVERCERLTGDRPGGGSVRSESHVPPSSVPLDGVPSEGPGTDASGPSGGAPAGSERNARPDSTPEAGAGPATERESRRTR